MSTEPERYTAYLLRMWQVNRDGAWALRVSLENIHTGERRGFAGLDALTEFLRQATGADDSRRGRQPSGDRSVGDQQTKENDLSCRN